jgi:hypothetical protein
VRLYEVIMAAILAGAAGAPLPAIAYRPFDSTDAAVADPWVVDAEIGYFNVSRQGGETTYATPKAVLNLGIVPNWEVIGEFEVEEPVQGDVAVADPGVFVKGVVKDGVLQDRAGPSVAVEVGVLLPATPPDERDAGFAGFAIVSAELRPLLFHLNAGGGVSRSGQSGFPIWGVIAELPVTAALRIAAEVNGESVESDAAEASALLGTIWDVPGYPLALDAGVRCGLTRAAGDWAVTVGFTYGFSLTGAAVTGRLE